MTSSEKTVPRSVPPLSRLLKLVKKLKVSQGQEERIHKIRVQSRRLVTHFHLKNISPKNKKLQRFLRRIRELRRRLGAVREMDVHIALWKRLAKDEPGFPGVYQELQSQRECQLKKFLKDWDPAALKRSLPPKEYFKSSKTIFPRRKIQNRIDGILKAQKEYQINLRLKFIHRVRIEVKKLRYSLEEVRGDLPVKLDSQLFLLKAMQDELGYIRDLETLIEELDKIKKKKKDSNLKARAGVEKMQDKIQGAIAEGLGRWEEQWLERKGLLLALKAFLNNIPGPPRKSS